MEYELFGEEVGIGGIGGEEEGGLFGEGCFEGGDVKNRQGRGGFMVMNSGEEGVK